jgi:hypothetical protein
MIEGGKQEGGLTVLDSEHATKKKKRQDTSLRTAARPVAAACAGHLNSHTPGNLLPVARRWRLGHRWDPRIWARGLCFVGGSKERAGG